MKRSEKQLPSKSNFSTSLQLKCSNFRLIQWKGLGVTRIVKEFKFEGVWGELESKKSFQRQSVAKCLRLTLVFMSKSALREKVNICF